MSRALSLTIAAFLAGAALSTGTAAYASETPREMECKDVATEGDELSTPGAMDRCEHLYGSPVTKFRWAKTHLHACAQEDSPGPCFWNAKTRGNGTGYSFWVDGKDAVHYRTAKIQRRMDAR